MKRKYYGWLAAVLAVLLGLLWYIFRKRNISPVLRQLFFAPVSYLAAHMLIKGIHATSFFPERDLLSIALISLAIYIMLSLGWQLWVKHRWG